MIGVTGATGQLGQIVIAKLTERLPADEVVALVRDPAKADELGLGVAARPFDYNDADQVLAGLDGLDGLLLISGSELGLREVQHRNVILAAMQQELRHIAYTSLLHADRSPLGVARDHVATEMMLRESGIPCTLLRNGWYLENYIDTALSALASGALYGAAGQGRISAASRADLAEAAAGVMAAGGPGSGIEVHELAGDDAFSLAELAATLSALAGEDIPYVNLAEADYAAALAETGLPAPWPQALARIDAQIAEGALYDDGQALSALLGRPTTPLAEVLAAALAAAPEHPDGQPAG